MLLTGVEVNRRNLITVSKVMRQRYRIYKRKNGGRYYHHDDVTGKQESLGTNDRATAVRLFHSRQEAEQQPAVNLQIARAYLVASDPQIATRNWQLVMDELVKLKKDQTQDRWQTAIKDKGFDLIRHLPILETRPEHFLHVLEAGKVSTNVYLRRIHNFALDMTWLLDATARYSRNFPPTEVLAAARPSLDSVPDREPPTRSDQLKNECWTAKTTRRRVPK